ncbi:MAG: hypothetical protein MJY74_05765, partial [Bacteroidaceae bacterium]|nr:hypothetical protein [Bacteroidaceae bacterium]
NGNNNNGTSGTGSTSIGGHSGNGSCNIFNGIPYNSLTPSTHILSSQYLYMYNKSANAGVNFVLDDDNRFPTTALKAKCNYGVREAFRYLFGAVPVYMESGVKANPMIKDGWRAHPEDWQSINSIWIEMGHGIETSEYQGLLNFVQDLANCGYFVVAGWYNPEDDNAMGHVAVVVPCERSLERASKWKYVSETGTENNYYVPFTMDTGRNNRQSLGKLSVGFGPDKIGYIEFFYYK